MHIQTLTYILCYMCLYTSICIEVHNSLLSFIVDDIGDDSESEIPDEVCNEEDIF